VEKGVIGTVTTWELDAFGLWKREPAIAGDVEVRAHGEKLRVIVLGVMQSQDLVSHNVFTALKPQWEIHRDLRSRLGEDIRAPATRDWSSPDARQLLEFHPDELLGNSLRAGSWALREVGHHRAVVVVWAQSGVTRWPETRAVPIEGHVGPCLGGSRDRSRTSNPVAGNIRAADIVDGFVATSVWPNHRWRSWRKWVCTREVNTVNGDFADETVAQNATKMDSRDNDGGGLDFREHDRNRAKSVEEWS